MKTKNPKVDLFLRDGCGRCPLVATPQCKVNDWRTVLKKLRAIALDCDLKEDLKWGFPCYTVENRNVAMVSAFKEYCALSFLKGALLRDAEDILDRPGENSQSVRLIRFTSVREVVGLEPTLSDYICEAIQVERDGLKVDFKAKTELVIPAELQQKFAELPALLSAFSALTPGRQRGFVLYFTAAKQSKTRESRIVKCIPHILEGRGLND